MKNSYLITNVKWTGIAGMIISVFMASVAFAQVTPDVSVVIKNQSNATTTVANIGTVVRAHTEVASSTGTVALGMVDFNLYGNTACSGTPSVQSGVLLASGEAQSATTTVGSNGLSYKVHFNGQVGVYNPADSNCVSVSATSNTVGISTSLSSTTVTVGSSVFQRAILSSVTANATGTVAYKIYTNNVCTLGEQSAGTKVVSNAIAPNSDSIQMNIVGTLYFQGRYSGDMNNTSATGLCQPLSVQATSTVPTPPPPPPPPPSTPGNGSLSGVTFNDLNKNLVKDGSEGGVSGFTINLYGGTFWWNWGGMSPIKTTTTDANGNYSFSNLSDGFYKIDEVKLSGWKQLSNDYKWVLILNGSNISGLNFANAQMSTTTTGNGSSISTSTAKNFGQFVKQIKMQEKEERKESKKIEKETKKKNKQQQKIQKLLERLNKLRGGDDDNDDD